MDIKPIVVRSIDVGYGHVKFTKSANGPGNFIYDSFPSVAVVDTRPAAMEFEDAPMTNTMTVNVGNTRYIVGPDAHLELKSDSSARVLHDDYVEEDGYMALNYGALLMMKQEHIDYLVVGLPVSLFHSRKQKLVELLRGEHQITSDFKVTIDNVVVLPQPMGSLFKFAFDHDDPEIQNEIYTSLKSENSLVVDPGYKTFDWIYSRYVHPLQNRSGSYHGGGMSRILETVGTLIEKEMGRRVTNMERLERGMVLYLNGQNPTVKLWGKPVDLKPYIEGVKYLAEESVNKLKNSVGNGEDVDNIILSGGPAEFFYDALAEAYPNHAIIKTKNSQLANVKGYQHAGLRKAASEAVKAGVDKNAIAWM